MIDSVHEVKASPCNSHKTFSTNKFWWSQTRIWVKTQFFGKSDTIADFLLDKEK